MIYVGVDGCPAGWITVRRVGADLDYGVFATIADVMAANSLAQRVLIDIPIGLPCAQAPFRECDRRARQLLGRGRRSSVFPVPSRSALQVTDIWEARRVNQTEVGRSLTAQTWAIAPKIAEVDAYLSEHPSAPLREVHPEVCFWALASKRPMFHRKSTRDGHEERLRVLEKIEPDIRSFTQFVLNRTLRKDVAADDVLDAAVAFVTAEARHGCLVSVVPDIPVDEVGRPMEMVYLDARSVA
jgi:predicted RNase H-like nuclease